MAIIEIPTRTDLPAYNYVVNLDGTSYKLSFTFNERMGKWFVAIATAIGEQIIDPVPVIATWPIFKRFKDSRLPGGTIFPFDTAGKNEDPGRFDLGDRVRLLYEEAS